METWGWVTQPLEAAFSEVTAAVFLLGPFASLAITVTLLDLFYGQGAWYLAVLPGVSLLSRLVLFVLLWRSHWDEQRFILKVMSKFVATLLWLFVIVVVFSLFLRDLSVSGAAYLWLVVADLCLLSMLSFAVLGIKGTARLPLGLRVLQVFFGRGRKACNALNVSERFVHATVFFHP